MHWAWAVAQKPFDAAARQSFTREVAASHLVSPSRLQVARQSYILEVSHIHLCNWHRFLPDRALVFRFARQNHHRNTTSGLCTNRCTSHHMYQTAPKLTSYDI